MASLSSSFPIEEISMLQHTCDFENGKWKLLECWEVTRNLVVELNSIRKPARLEYSIDWGVLLTVLIFRNNRGNLFVALHFHLQLGALIIGLNFVDQNYENLDLWLGHLIRYFPLWYPKLLRLSVTDLFLPSQCLKTF